MSLSQSFSRPPFTYETDAAGTTTAVYSLIYLPTDGVPTITELGGYAGPTAPASSPASSDVGISSTSSSAPSNLASGPTSPPTSAAPSSPLIGLSVSSASSVTTTTGPTTSDTSTPITQISSSTSSRSTRKATSGAPVPSPSNRLPNGTVAGIVVGVALGIALITFLATYIALRRRGRSRKRNNQGSDGDGGPAGAARRQIPGSEPKQPLVTQTSSGSNSIDGFLPQSADDKTVQNEVKTVLDQIELHVENFYQNTQVSGSRLADAELAMFDSPYLPSSLASLLPQTKNSIPLIKHALAHCITACITTPSESNWSLLPKDFVLLPNAVKAGGSTRSTKQGFTQSMSRWRALTAYLRPNALEDTAYIAQRDRQINIIVQNFSIAFASWQNPRYKDEERVRSLVAILKDAADKGIWLFSQPSEFQFQWRKLNPGRIAVAPALVKTTDERGQVLGQPQVMINMTSEKT